jgi:hypothetical protein
MLVASILSHFFFQAPGLAPGTTGKAPLVGEWRKDKRIVLVAQADGINTGDFWRDVLLKGFFSPSIGITTEPLSNKYGFKQRKVSIILQTARFKAPMTIPLSFQQTPPVLSGHFSFPLAAFGVTQPNGQDAGPLTIDLKARFKD